MTDGIRFLDGDGCVPVETETPIQAACCGAVVTELVNRLGETRCVACDADVLERLDIADADVGVML